MGADPSALLSGYRALDLGSVMGAFCGKLLSDLGVDVIKVEPPSGDPLRSEPPFASGHEDREGSLRFAYLNAGKRGVTLDLTRREGRDIFLQLVGRSDVILECYEPGYMDSLGLGYGVLSKYQPKIILASLTGFGQSGPYSNYQAPDIVTTAMGGLLYISGDPALPPCMPPETQSYYYSCIFAAYGVMLALWRREVEGIGVHIDASVQASLALHEHVAFTYSLEGRLMKRAGSQHQHVAPANLFPCKDGYISIFVSGPHWASFLEIWQDHPPELDDPRWKSNAERRTHADWLNPLVASFTSRYEKEELSILLQENGIPGLPVNTPADFMQDPHIQERGFFGEVTHPAIGPYQQASVPFTVNGERAKPAPPPLLGQHNSEVYGSELGLSEQDIQVLAAEGVI